MNKFKAGDKIFSVAYGDNHRKGKVICHSKRSFYVDVEWSNGDIAKVWVNDIKLESLHDAWLEVESKMKQIATLLSESDAILKANNEKLLNCGPLVEPLFATMDKVGWRTSSMEC